MKKSSIALLVGGLFLATGVAQAKEGGDQYPNGAENWYAGALPPPGTYFINYFGYYGGKLQDGSGNAVKNPANSKEARVDAFFDALRVVHVTNTQILGGNWAMHAILPIVSQSVGNLPGTVGSASKFGIGDITIDPLVITWHHSPELHTAFGFDINLPTGAYDKDDARKSIGANYYSFEPIYAVTWLPQGSWELSAKLMYNIKTKNNDSVFLGQSGKYQSGDEFHMDYLVGKKIGDWAVGVSGYYLKQITNDKFNGETVQGMNNIISTGRKGQVFAFGPSVKYTTKTGTMFVAQWQHETMVENRFQGDKLWFKLVTPL
ncbi:transporter [Zoogloea sp.]|uniref:SphA family protein n=1 Tax=Zoogloea sp. TaxID=49181 RepID=UPI0035B4B990